MPGVVSLNRQIRKWNGMKQGEKLPQYLIKSLIKNEYSMNIFQNIFDK